MVATPHFSDWYLYLPTVVGAARKAFLSEMSPFGDNADEPKEKKTYELGHGLNDKSMR